MDASVDGLATSIRDITLSGSPSRGRRHESLHSACSNLASLDETIQGLSEATKAVTSQARSVELQADNVDEFDHHSVADVILLIQQTKSLTKSLTNIAKNLEATVEVLIESPEHCILRQLSSFRYNRAAVTSGGTAIQELLIHFDRDIKNVIRTVTDTHSDQSVLWRVAVECYQQAASPCGPLHINNYLLPFREASLQSPFDPDFESEEYYEHENRLDCAEAYRAQAEYNAEVRSAAHRRYTDMWPGFWISAINQSPRGPTLFYPPAGLHGTSLTMDVPRYLFRTFDGNSSGVNDGNVIASTASEYDRRQDSRNDILGLEKHVAAELLYAHLKAKSPFSGDISDNLMSWTSSLLFAIQYAIWRTQYGGNSASTVKICAIDTREFPIGQFMRDIALLEAYRPAAGQAESQFFDFRLNCNEYYNGEYLSQGSLDHTSRSCMMSLEQLVKAGLHQLYPEFKDKAGRHSWTNRVKDLRSSWETVHATTGRDVKLAIAIGRKCFGHFELCDIASLILTLKNRRMSK